VTAEPALSPAMLRAGRVPLRLLTWGVPMGALRLLQTQGRRSGRRRTAPVAVVRLDGQEWLVSPFGETQWVRNVRANGVASLVAVDDDRRPAVLQRYRRVFRMVPFVRDAFDADPGDLEAFQRDAHRYPVFSIIPAGETSRRDREPRG
jgi:hypothetical protein